jgi:hypothetical protein
MICIVLSDFLDTVPPRPHQARKRRPTRGMPSRGTALKGAATWPTPGHTAQGAAADSPPEFRNLTTQSIHIAALPPGNRHAAYCPFDFPQQCMPNSATEGRYKNSLEGWPVEVALFARSDSVIIRSSPQNPDPGPRGCAVILVISEDQFDPALFQLRPLAGIEGSMEFLGGYQGRPPSPGQRCCRSDLWASTRSGGFGRTAA